MSKVYTLGQRANFTLCNRDSNIFLYDPRLQLLVIILDHPKLWLHSINFIAKIYIFDQNFIFTLCKSGLRQYSIWTIQDFKFGLWFCIFQNYDNSKLSAKGPTIKVRARPNIKRLAGPKALLNWWNRHLGAYTKPGRMVPWCRIKWCSCCCWIKIKILQIWCAFSWTIQNYNPHP